MAWWWWVVLVLGAWTVAAVGLGLLVGGIVWLAAHPSGRRAETPEVDPPVRCVHNRGAPTPTPPRSPP